jgi:hypothetical protein
MTLRPRWFGLVLAALMLAPVAPARSGPPEAGAAYYSPQLATAHWVIQSDEGPVYVAAGALKVTGHTGGVQSYAYVGQTSCDFEVHHGTMDLVCVVRTRLRAIPNRNFQIDRLLRQASLVIPDDGMDHSVSWLTTDDVPGLVTGSNTGPGSVSVAAGVDRPARASGTVYGLDLDAGKRNGRLYEGVDAVAFVRSVYDGAPVVIRFRRSR